MRFSLLQFLLFVTGACVLCAVVAHIPLARGILAAFALGGGVSLLVAKVCSSRVGQ
jgi:hypothetical protein